MNLYEMTQAQAELIALLESHTDPETGELDPAYAASLEASELATAQKLEAVEAYRRGIRAEAVAFKAEEDRLTKRRKAMEARDESLGLYIGACLDLAGMDNLKVGTFDFRMQASAPSIIILDEIELIPPEYLIPQPPKVDKSKIKDALSNGVELEFATLRRGRHLRVR